jgi:Ca2+-binding RTX toxin-like protein
VLRHWVGIAASTTAIVGALVLPAVPAAAAVTSEVAEERLTVRGDAADDSIVVTCVDGDVKVNGSDPDTGRAECAGLFTIFVLAGSGDDHVTLEAVDPAAGFTELLSTYVAGALGNDMLRGSITGDDLVGHGGVDDLFGGPGDDELVPGGADDGLADGEDGFDRVSVTGSGSWTITDDRIERIAPDPIVIDIRSVESAKIRGGTEDDSIDATLFSGVGGTALRGRAGNDRLISGIHDDQLIGGAGDDRMIAGDGDDSLLGKRGKDVLRGRDGADFLNGGAGADSCRGGRGEDFLTETCD